MPLSEKDSRKLITDLAKYIEEDKWTKQNIDKLEKAGKITEVDADFLRKKQETANRKRDKLEDEIAKVVVARFPARFGKPRGEKKEKEVKPKEVIVPKEEPAIIEVPKTVLERINSGIETQAAYFSSYGEIAKAQLEAFNTIKEIAEEDRAIRENYSEIAYPAAGGEKTISAGMTVLDLWTGDVTLGDGTEDHLSDSLMAVGQLYARSIYVDCNKKFSVQLDGKSKHTIKADDFFSCKGIQCQRIFIDVDEATKLKFWCSTNPTATIEEMRNVVVTGVETQLSSRQLRWKHIDEPTALPKSTIAGTYYVQAAIKTIGAGWRLIVNNITLVCSKSCIQRLEWAIVDENTELADITDEDWSVNDYDTTASLSFDVYHSAIVDPGEKLAVRYWNHAGEALTFYLTTSGLLEKV